MDSKNQGVSLIEILIGGAIVAILIAVFSPITIVGPNERGVAVALGKASENVLGPGPHFRFPFVRSVHTMSVLVQKTEMDSKAGTKDLQDVQTHAALNWHINADDVVKIYTTIGDTRDIEHNIIVPAFNEVTKQATARKTAEEVLGRRAELKDEVDKALTSHLAKYGIAVDDVNIINVTFTQEFEAAVEKKQVAEQRAKQAEYEALQATTEAKAAIAKATGEAQAQKLLKETVDDKILRRMAIEKWDGHFPQMMGSGALPLVDFRSTVAGTTKAE